MVDFVERLNGAAADPVFAEIVAVVLRHCEPELVLLFGSRASGAARDDSDYDVMIVLGDRKSPRALESAVRNELSHAAMSADIVARTADDYLRWQRDPGLLDYVAARQGRVLYSAGRLEQLTDASPRIAEHPPVEGLAMWIERAERDLNVAEMLVVSGDRAADAICFHAHAAVEKLLKTQIVRGGRFPPRTHDLNRLVEMQAAAIAGDPSAREACAALMAVFPRSRYPELALPTFEEAEAALGAARCVFRLLR